MEKTREALSCEQEHAYTRILLSLSFTFFSPPCLWSNHTASARPRLICSGADDLLLLFLYIIIKADVPNLYAETEFICDYVTSKQTSMGVGYYMGAYSCCFLLCLI